MQIIYEKLQKIKEIIKTDWYGFHTCDSSGKHGRLGVLFPLRPYHLVWLVIKENVFTLRLTVLWFGVG